MTYGGPPKVCCFKARSVIILFSLMGFFVCIWQVLANDDHVTRATGAISGLLELVLLWGVVKNRPRLLKVAMYISLIHLTFDFGTILVSPVYFASQTASGYESNDTYPIFPIIFGAKSREEDRFILGLVTGYSVEIFSTISVFLGILQFVLINRCYVYRKMIENGVLKKTTVLMKF
ncbi:unnamed protein product [Caenorhabditis sp. 36 PRJEB53466]|nr:unnamed protein product [Caenorhabditis sp. 36 PRJEB53466]